MRRVERPESTSKQASAALASEIYHGILASGELTASFKTHISPAQQPCEPLPRSAKLRAPKVRSAQSASLIERRPRSRTRRCSRPDPSP
eukprot:1557985-Prymnesium_polylepis.1